MNRGWSDRKRFRSSYGEGSSEGYLRKRIREPERYEEVEGQSEQYETTVYAYSPTYHATGSPAPVQSEDRYGSRMEKGTFSVPNDVPAGYSGNSQASGKHNERRRSVSPDLELLTPSPAGFFDPFVVGRKIMNYSSSNPAERREFFAETIRELKDPDIHRISDRIKSFRRPESRVLGEALVALSAKLLALSEESLRLDAEYEKLRSSVSNVKTSELLMDVSYQPRLISVGKWKVNEEGLTVVEDVKDFINELDDDRQFIKRIPARAQIYIVTRYIISRIIPPTRYKLFALRERVRDNKKDDFPAEVVRTIIGMHCEACAVTPDDIAERLDVEVQTRRAIRNTLDDLRRSRPRLSASAARRNREQWGWVVEDGERNGGSDDENNDDHDE